MAIGEIRALVVATNFANLSVAATVTRPDETPIETIAIWLTDETEDRPTGQDFSRRDRRRVLALKTADVPTVPLGTRITAALPVVDASDQGWVVDGFDRYEAEHVRVVVVPDLEWQPDDEDT